MALLLEMKELERAKILAVGGRLALGEGTAQFRSTVKEILGDADWLKNRWGWNAYLVLDLAHLNYIDSAGLGALVAAHTTAVNQGVEIKMANLNKGIRDLLNLTKVVTIFDVYDSVEAAVKSFAPQQAEAASGAV